MSTPHFSFFVYLTTTYARSKKWDVTLSKFPFESGTWIGKLTKWDN